MSKSFSIKQTDPQGLARLSNEIRLLWDSVEKLQVKEVISPPTPPTSQEIAIGGYSLSPTKFLDETGYYDTVKDVDLDLADVTTNDVSITKHGFAPKAPNDSTKFLTGIGTYAVPAGTSSVATSISDSKAGSAVTKSDSTDVSQSVLISNLDSRLVLHGI